MKRHVFCEFIRSLDIPKGSVILMDNASIHKGDDVVKVFRVQAPRSVDQEH